MPIEAVTYISDLNPANPVGSTDKVQTLDDHVRNIKSGLLNTFPNITGAVTATHAELSALAGTTGATGTGKLVRDTGPTLNAPNVTGGLTADTINGVAPADFARLSQPNIFAALQTITAADGTPALKLAGVTGKIRAYGYHAGVNGGAYIDATNNAESLNLPLTLRATSLFLEGTTQISVNGVNANDYARLSLNNVFGGNNQKISAATATLTANALANTAGRRAFDMGSFSDAFWIRHLSDDLSASLANFFTYTPATQTITLNAAALTLFGNLSTPNVSAREVGFKGAPMHDLGSGGELSTAYAGECIHWVGGAGPTIALPGGMPDGECVAFLNQGSGAFSIGPGSGGAQVFLAGTGFAITGTFSLAVGGFAVATKFGGTYWLLAGTGLS